MRQEGVLLLLACVCTVDALDLKATVIEAEGFCELDKNTKKWFGFIPSVVNELGRRLNFTPIYERVADGRYGRFEETTGIWSGMIGEVVKGNADFAAAPLTQTSQRESHVDFTHEVLDVGLVLVVKTPVNLHPVTRSAGFFLGVFDFGAWLGVLAVLIIAWLVVYNNARFNPRERKMRSAGGGGGIDGDDDFSLLNALFFVISTGCLQGFKHSPRSLAGRCVSTMWWLFAMIVASMYIGGLLCGLVASRGSLDRRFSGRDPRLQFASDSTSLNNLVPLWMPQGSTDAYMSRADDPFLRKLNSLKLQYAEKNPDFYPSITNLTRILQLLESDSKYVGVLESDMANLYARRSQCRLSVASSLLTDKSYAFAFAEHSNWTRKFNAAILQLREEGFVRASYLKFFGSDGDGCGFNSAPAETLAMGLIGQEMASMFRDSLPITLGTMIGPIFFFCFGLLLTLAAGVTDAFIYTRYERYQNPQPFQTVQSGRGAPFGDVGFDEPEDPIST